MVEKVTFYTVENLTRKVFLWFFFMSETSEKNKQFNFSSQNLSFRMEFFQMSSKSNQDMTPILFHRIWEKPLKT